MKSSKILKHLLLSITILSAICFTNSKVSAATIDSDNIPGSAYIIGTHMFTRDTNQAKGYDGKLTTNLIMLASKTIESGSIDDMIIYYKTASGKWINGLSGSEISAPASFKINYTNLELEEENDTVKAPKKPIIFWDTGLSYNKEKNTFSALLTVLLDDENDTNNKVDGVEVRVSQNGEFDKSYDLTYDEYFKDNTTTFNKEFKRDIEGIVIGNTYHNYEMNIENITIGQGAGYVTINARTYVLDENGKKVYSDMLVDTISDEDHLPFVQVKNSYSNPSYVSKEDGYYNYQLEIEKPFEWVPNSLSQKNYAYYLSGEIYYYNGLVKKNDSYVSGIYGLDEKAMVTIPENKIATFSAVIGYYKKDGTFVYYNWNETPTKTLTIDTRTLEATPSAYVSISTTQDAIKGERIRVATEPHMQACSDSDLNALDCNVEGTEIYEIVYKEGKRTYKLISSSGQWWTDVMPTNGHGQYVARSFATNAAGETVYSNFSNIVEVVRTPEIEVSEVKNGKVTVSIKNLSEYGTNNSAKYKVYTDGDVELKTVDSISDIATIDVSSNMNIYAKVYDTFGQEEDSVYSEKSNIVNVEIDK